MKATGTKERKRPERRSRRRRAKLPRVLVLLQSHLKAPYEMVELHIAGGRRAMYALFGQIKVVKS